MPEQAPSPSEVLRAAAAAGVLAPSVHNTQPWSFVINDDVLELHADPSRQLDVLDPTGRQLIISCGCALFNIRVALAARQYQAVVERFPDPDQPNLVARVSLPEAREEWVPLAGLADQIERRRTNRRRYEDEPVPAEVVYELVNAATEEQAKLWQVQQDEDRMILARLTQRADELENADPAYRAELRRWTSDDPLRRDGVPQTVVPHVTGESHDDIPIRDFDTRGLGWLPTETRSSVNQCLLLLGTMNEGRMAWLHAGEAMEHLWLLATRFGYVASLFTQVIEIPYTRELLRAELDLGMHPHALIRIGHAPATPPMTRRLLEDVLTQTGR